MNHQFQKHFTVDEANTLIPHVRKLFAEVLALLKPQDEEEEHDDLMARATNGNGNGKAENGNGHGNGHGHSQTSHYNTWSKEKRREAAYRLLNALQEQGIVIQDVERGLIDFPAIVDEREVFLCYELSDGHSISYFHDLDAGYAGRQKLSGEHQ